MSDQSAADGSPFEEVTRAPDPTAPSAVTIGPYRLLQRVGEGGMGEVWLAEQSRPVRRQVALKVIKVGMDTAHVVARFEAERQALAMMDHPAIAKVFDAGATPQGRPYFVMEYVRGEAITVYCSRHRLSTRDRLGLFLQVCDGVQHAHQKGIIHRDLKPSNLLVTVLDAHPVPKIIDFGVAKAITQPLTDRTLLTELGMLVGTPEYMSPEQAEMTGLDIDTRTDVYALGVILYELLTGVLPFDAKLLREKGLDEIRRTIREVEPPRPSARVTLAASTESPQSRHPDTAGLARDLRGDLDWITMRALEKDRTRRYGSAAELAADVRRHLDHLPVVASPPSTRYRVKKFVRRHRVGVGVAATLVVLLFAFTVTTAIQARRIALERDRANREAEVARAVNNFLKNDLLAQASASAQAAPDTKPDPDLKVRTALDRAAARIAGKFGTQPLVEASIRRTIGDAYMDLGLYPEAQRQMERARELRRGVMGENDTDALGAMSHLGELYWRQGKYTEADPLMTRVVELQRRLLGEGHPETVRSMDLLALVYRAQGDYARAESLLTKAVEAGRRGLGEENPVTLDAVEDLALVYSDQGKQAQAEPLYTRTLEIWRRVRGEEHPSTLNSMNNLALVYTLQGKYAQAEPIFAKALEVRRRVLGQEHPETLRSVNNLGGLYRRQGKYDQAEALYTAALDLRTRILGEQHPDTLRSMESVADLYKTQGKYPQAAALYTKVLELRRRVLGVDHPTTTTTVASIGEIRLLQRRYTEAEASFRDALKAAAKTTSDNWEPYSWQSMLGASLAGQNKSAEAEPLLVSGYEGMVQRQAAISAANRSSLEQARQRIVQLYLQWGKPEKAAEWQRKFETGKIGSAR